MVGPSGADVAAPDTPHTFDDAFRAFAAASQGDLDRAGRLMGRMPDTDLDGLLAVARVLARRAQRERNARQATA